MHMSNRHLSVLALVPSLKATFVRNSGICQDLRHDVMQTAPAEGFWEILFAVIWLGKQL